MKLKPLFMSALITFAGLVVAGEDKPIAEVYGQKVTLDMLGIPDSLVEKQRSEMPKAEFDKWLAEGRKSQLSYGIMQEARKHFLKEMKMEPTEKEVDSYLAFMQRSADKMKQENLKEIARLKKEVAKPGLSSRDRDLMEENIRMMQEINQGVDRKKSQEDLKIDRQLAEQAVAEWKFYKALYHKYGGRVIAQQAGYEPIDALKAFLEEMKKKGDYRILDPAYEGVFQETLDYIDNPNHDFVDKAEAEKYFADPWWENR